MNKKLKIAVIGGGASGMMAAITAAREGAAVFLYEKKKEWERSCLPPAMGSVTFPTGICAGNAIMAKTGKKHGRFYPGLMQMLPSLSLKRRVCW